MNMNNMDELSVGTNQLDLEWIQVRTWIQDHFSIFQHGETGRFQTLNRSTQQVWMFMKCLGGIGLETRNSRLHSGTDPDSDLDPGSIFPLSAALRDRKIGAFRR